MNKQILFCLFLLSVLFSCSKDDKLEEVIPVIPEILEEELIVNPLKVSPFTAKWEVKTNVKTKVSILIKGQDGEDLVHDFEEFSTSHIIPILGLYAGCENRIIITLTSESSGMLNIEKKIETEKLPWWYEIKQFSPVMKDATKVADGFVMMFLSGTDGLAGRNSASPVMIDKFGKIRWVYFGEINHVFKKLSNGHYLVDGNGTGFYEIDLLGTTYGYWKVAEGIHRDAVETFDNTILFLSRAEGSVDDGVIELCRVDGSYLNEWDIRQYLDVTRPQAPNDSPADDWLHLNGIDFQKEDNSFIISGRNQSAVLKINRDTGKLKWILGNHEYWNDDLKSYLLTPVGDDFEWQWAQHAPVFNPQDPTRILLFDNGCARSYDHPLPASQNYSRVVEYCIDESAMTVKQTWQFGKEFGCELYSSYISNVRYLDNGNILICYGGLTKDLNGNAVDFGDSDVCNSVRVLEISRETKEIVWDLKLENENNRKLGYRSYRAYKIDMYN